MILKRLTLSDFGPYAGCQTLELGPGPERPIVLVGGQNGSGKTTILEAITLCLHGRRGLGPRLSQAAYEQHLQRRLHIAPGGPIATEAALTLEFEHAFSGMTREYAVTRRFVLRKSTIKEELAITCDGEPLTEVGKTAWQDFLDGLMPPGVAGLFLFDGEKVQTLADDDNGGALADAVRTLLGVDVVGQLSQDLRRLATEASPAGRAESDALCDAESALTEIDTRLAELKDGEAKIVTRRDRRLAQVGRTQQRLAQQGGALAAERDQLLTDAHAAEAEVAACNDELAQLVAGLLPFAIAPRLAKRVSTRLKLEQTSDEARVVVRRLDASAAELAKKLKATGKQPVIETLKNVLVGDLDLVEPLNDVSAAERETMRQQLDRARRELPRTASALRRRLVRAQEKLERARMLLAKVPEESALAPIVAELQTLEREVGKFDAELERIEDERRRLNHERLHRVRARDRAAAKLAKATGAGERGALALRAATLLDEFGTALEAQRLEEIEQLTTWYFNRLSHKGELLSAVTIDPATFVVTVRRWDGSELPKESLSAGEKQLFAIAVLWALAEVSRRKLPVVIDTPLARLDQDHRVRLLEQYFPEVSHQVVILSTDTEVDLDAVETLEPKIARQVWLRHDPSQGATTVESGYFNLVKESAGAG